MDQVLQIHRPQATRQQQIQPRARHVPSTLQKERQTHVVPPSTISREAPLQTAAQKHMNEVQGIFTKVDDVLKKRKETCMRLVWEITDLQTQLEYAEKNTRECAETCGAQEVALAWTKRHIADLRVEHDRVKKTHVEPMEQLAEELQSLGSLCDNQCSSMSTELHQITSSLGALSFPVKESFEMTQALLHQNDLQQAAIHEERTHVRELSERKKALNESLEQFKEKLLSKQAAQKEINETLMMSNGDIISELYRLKLTSEKLSCANEALIQNKESVELLQQLICKIRDERKLRLEEREEAIRILRAENESLENEVHQMESSIASHTIRKDTLAKELVKLEEHQHRLRAESGQLSVRVDTLKKESAEATSHDNDLRDQVQQAQLELQETLAMNETSYRETCDLLKVLHELHQTETQLKCELEAIQAERSKRVRDAEEENKRLSLEIEKLMKDFMESSIKKQSEEAELEMIKEIRFFAEEDVLSTLFNIQLAEECLQQLHDEKHFLDEEIVKMESTQKQTILEVEEKQDELSGLRKRLENLDRDYELAASELEEMSRSPIKVSLTEDENVNIDEKVEEEFLSIKHDIDSEFEEREAHIRHCREQIASKSIENMHADLRREIDILAKKIEEKKLQRELQSIPEHGQHKSLIEKQTIVVVPQKKTHDDSMLQEFDEDSNLIPRFKSARRLISVQESSPVKRKKEKVELVPKSSQRDWFTDNDDFL